MTSPATVARAIELDDDAPDDVCPGCGRDITGWQRYEAHYPPGVGSPRAHEPAVIAARSMPMPWTVVDGRTKGACPWTADYLAARAHRRRLIEEAASCRGSE